jgi:hypothetical protein
MENKFTLSHVVLYAKGWYQKSDNVWEDLKQILEYDNYTPFDKMDVYSIIINATQKSNIYRWTELREVLDGIHPKNCWKVGYYVKDNVGWCNKAVADLPDYDMPTAFIYYVLSNLRFIDSTKWTIKIPKYTKEFRRPKHITLKSVIDHFNIKKT